MLSIFFIIVVPLLIGAALALLKRIPKRYWLAVVALVAIAEPMFIGIPSPSWQFRHVAASFLLTVFLPWIGVGFYIYLMPFPKRIALAALGVPVVYFVLLGFGLVMGDTLGLIPQ